MHAQHLPAGAGLWGLGRVGVLIDKSSGDAAETPAVALAPGQHMHKCIIIFFKNKKEKAPRLAATNLVPSALLGSPGSPRLLSPSTSHGVGQRRAEPHRVPL